jgi:hypothetical protein
VLKSNGRRRWGSWPTGGSSNSLHWVPELVCRWPPEGLSWSWQKERHLGYHSRMDWEWSAWGYWKDCRWTSTWATKCVLGWLTGAWDVKLESEKANHL